MTCGDKQRFWRSLVHDPNQSSWQSSFDEDPVVIAYYEMVEHRLGCEVCKNEDMARGGVLPPYRPSAPTRGH
jgi:hypothetical protein